MISFLNGQVIELTKESVLIDVGNIGYSAKISKKTYEELEETTHCFLLTVLIHKEDSMELVGFIDEEEKQAFKSLVKISGVGVKAALMLLSEFTPYELNQAIIVRDSKLLCRVKGVGNKLVEKLFKEYKTA